MPHLTFHTHPRWVPQGTIKGWMPWRRIGQRPVFKAKVGFIRGAGGEVTFQVWEHHRSAGREVWNKVAQLTKRAEGVLRELTADLSHLAEQEVGIELRVDAGESSGQDWAVWVDPQIEYDDSADTAAEAILQTGVRFGDTVELTATAWAVDPAGSRQLGGAMDISITVDANALSGLANRGLKAPERVLDALLGASPGQRFSVTLEPQEAFGVLQGARPTEVPRSALPVEPAVGMPFQLEGETETYWVVSIQGDNVRLDVNHPWAGYRIRFDGEITATRRDGAPA